ncbi:MAG: hypothetical protein AAGK01_10860 [Pseudomonadota bacterium]
MNTDTNKRSGVLGRGPLFWGVMVLITTAAIVFLGLSRALDSKATMLVLLCIPVALLLVMFRSAYKLADGKGESCIAQGEAQKRYIKRVAISTSAYLASFGLLMFADRQMELGFALKFSLALLPGFAICGVFWAIARLILEEKDEFLRMLTIRQALTASAFALSAASVWGFLESADVVPHIDAYYWAVAWFFGLFIGAAWNRIEYGTWGAA